MYVFKLTNNKIIIIRKLNKLIRLKSYLLLIIKINTTIMLYKYIKFKYFFSIHQVLHFHFAL